MDISSVLLSSLPETNWQLLGEFKLSLGTDADGLILAWLVVILEPLSLQPEFLHRILKAAQEVTARLLRSDLKLEHIHLIILVPDTKPERGQNWGFFRVEKVEGPDHAVEFYLYPEGAGLSKHG